MKRIFTISIVVIATVLFVRAVASEQPNKAPQDALSTEPYVVAELDSLNESLVEQADIEKRIPTREICVGEFCDGSGSGESDHTVVRIPLITSGGNVGCGSRLFFGADTVPKTAAVEDATYRRLFELKPLPELEYDDIRNIVGQEEQLFYRGITLNTEGVAKLDLEGSTRVIYNCTIPEFKAQIEQAALQFDTISSLEVYLNGELWDWCDYSQADPKEDKCNVVPKYWIASK